MVHRSLCVVGGRICWMLWSRFGSGWSPWDETWCPRRITLFWAIWHFLGWILTQQCKSDWKFFSGHWSSWAKSHMNIRTASNYIKHIFQANPCKVIYMSWEKVAGVLQEPKKRTSDLYSVLELIHKCRFWLVLFFNQALPVGYSILRSRVQN